MPTRYGIGASSTSMSSQGRIGMRVCAQLIGHIRRAKQFVSDEISVIDELSVAGPWSGPACSNLVDVMRSSSELQPTTMRLFSRTTLARICKSYPAGSSTSSSESNNGVYHVRAFLYSSCMLSGIFSLNLHPL